MKVLLATNDLKTNPIIRQLVGALEGQHEIDTIYCGVDAFWGEPFHVDIIHLHWPAILFNWQEPDENALRRLQTQLAAWRAHAPLVITVHDRYPHYQDTPVFRRLFDIVFEQVDGTIHMGQTSSNESIARYPRLASLPQTFIPIGRVDTFFRNEISRAEARRRLAIRDSVYTYLSFGNLRSIEETKFLIAGFKMLPMPDKYLVIAGPKVVITEQRSKPIRVYQRLRLKLDPKIHLRRNFVPDDDVQIYVNAADVVVIPRLQILNSSNISLGYSFGKVVVGPDDGNVGEILRETGNPTFQPGDVKSFCAALERGRKLDKEGKGQENLRYVQQAWDWELIAARHVEFYQRVIQTSPHQ
jgi:beta-1,4-mannosyltransferase